MVLKITVKLTTLCESHRKSHKSQSIIFVTIPHQKAQVFVTLSQVWQQWNNPLSEVTRSFTIFFIQSIISNIKILQHFALKYYKNVI